MMIRATIIVSLLFATAAARAEQSGLACLASTSSDYIRQKYAMFRATPLSLTPSIEVVIARRRMAEAFCLRSAHCISDDVNSIMFQGTFASCVKNEAQND